VILAAGLSPAWQQILRFETLHPGEVNRAMESVWCASGKVVNVAVGAALLGQDVRMVSPRGGLTGKMMEQDLRQFSMRMEWIETTPPTRVCTTLLEDSGTTTELVENSANLSPAEIEEFLSRVREAARDAEIVLLTGSIPRNAAPDLFARVLEKSAGRAVLDLRGEPLLHCLRFSPFLVKPNREELQATVQTSIRSDQELLQAMSELNQRGAKWVVVSEGGRAVWVTSGEKAIRFTPPRIHVVNPIGCGDALAAGIACELERSGDVLAAVRFGMGAAAHNAEQLLPARLDPHRSRQLAEQIQVHDVSN